MKKYHKDELIAEIKKVAKKLNTTSLTQAEFETHSKLSRYAISSVFSTWRRALVAAGLQKAQNPSCQNKINDEDLLREIIRLTRELQKIPSSDDMYALGKYSRQPYNNRWGAFTNARSLAYKKYGIPDIKTGKPATGKGGRADISAHKSGKPSSPDDYESQISYPGLLPKALRPAKSTKPQYGEPIDFRGLRHAPINEQGVVYLFGMLSRELGFLVEGVGTSYPDCRAKRCVDPDENRWEEVEIEFEYKSSNFKQHRHDPEKCDLVVCWVHDDTKCPPEVIELKPIVERLKK